MTNTPLTTPAEIAHSVATTRESRAREIENLQRSLTLAHIDAVLDMLDETLHGIVASHRGRMGFRRVSGLTNNVAQVQADRYATLDGFRSAIRDAEVELHLVLGESL